MKNNIYIFGTGRWAKEIILYIHKIINIEIFIISNKPHFKKWAEDQNIKNIIFLKKLPKNKESIKSKILILSLVKKHFSQIKLCLKNQYKEIFVEKPLIKITNDRQLKLLNQNKNKIFLSRIFSYDERLKSFFKMIKIRKIKLIKIFWHDPKIEKRRKLIKFQDKSINYSTDVIPHIINILDLIFGHQENKPKKIKIDYDLSDKSEFNFYIKNILVKCDLNRISKRKRIIEIQGNDIYYKFDFSKNKRYALKKIVKNKNYKKIFTFKSSNLQKMVRSFICHTHRIKYLNYKYSKNFFSFMKNFKYLN